MLSPEFSRERFYSDAFAILSNWDGVILRIELYLIFKKWVASIIFMSLVQALVWFAVLLELNKAFVITTILSACILLDLGKYRILPAIESVICRCTGFDASKEVELALKNQEIYSIQELSYHTARYFRLFISTLNVFAPYRHQYPAVSLVIGVATGIFLIWLGSLGREGQFSYALINVFLLLPGLLHHRVFPRIWSQIKPYIESLEAELDRGQFETMEERDAGEKEHWEPIASSPFFTGAQSSFFSSHPADDLDISESQFIQSFIPERVQRSTLKSRFALNTLTREIMMTSRNQDDIDEWFAEANGHPTAVDLGKPGPVSVDSSASNKNNNGSSRRSNGASAGGGDNTATDDWGELSPEIRQQQRHQQKQPRHRRSCCNIVTEGAIWMASLLALTPPPASSSVRTLTTSGGGNLMLTAPPTHAEKTHALSI